MSRATSSSGGEERGSKAPRCINCSQIGHTQKKCEPIVSLGVIAVRKDVGGDFEFLLIQRRHTIGYLEFIKGRYPEHDKDFLKRLLGDLPEYEREKIVTLDFSDLWNEIWANHNCRYYKRDFDPAYVRFKTLREDGLIIDGKRVFLHELLAETKPLRRESEWGFPKGHRKWFDEADLDCAIREFNEETNYRTHDYIFITNDPYIEDFLGLNRKLYRYLYFPAVMTVEKMPYIDPRNINQVGEVGDIGWFKLDEAIEKINPLVNPGRVEVLQNYYNHLHAQETITSTKRTEVISC